MFLACSNDEPVINEPPVVTPNEKPAEAKDIMLAVNPSLEGMKTRAIVEAFQAGHTMGVFTTDNGGGAVGSNVSFAYDGNEWKAGGNAPVKGDMNVTAYFPYSASVTDYREIPVDLTRQEDCLYGTARVTKQVPTAALTMKHALSLVRIKVIIRQFCPIFYLILLHIKYTFSKYNLFFPIYDLSILRLTCVAYNALEDLTLFPIYRQPHIVFSRFQACPYISSNLS